MVCHQSYRTNVGESNSNLWSQYFTCLYRWMISRLDVLKQRKFRLLDLFCLRFLNYQFKVRIVLLFYTPRFLNLAFGHQRIWMSHWKLSSFFHCQTRWKMWNLAVKPQSKDSKLKIINGTLLKLCHFCLFIVLRGKNFQRCWSLSHKSRQLPIKIKVVATRYLSTVIWFFNTISEPLMRSFSNKVLIPQTIQVNQWPPQISSTTVKATVRIKW